MGKVYVLTNDVMPGIVKIGITDGKIEDRIKTLDNTSLPLPFRFYFAIDSERHKEIETFVHDAFADYRVRENREFFKIDPERVVAALRISGAQEVKLGNQMIDDSGAIVAETSSTALVRRKRFSFTLVDIPMGTEIKFTRDANKKCTVISDSSVEYEGKEYSLTKLADLLLTQMGYRWKSVQGPAFFEYNGKTLAQIKKDREAEEDVGEEGVDFVADVN